MQPWTFASYVFAARWPVIVCLWITVAACSGFPQGRSFPPATPGPKDPAATPVAGLPEVHFTIQVGAFSTSGRAANQAARLKAAGLDAYHFVDSDLLHKVRFERFDTWEAARERALELQSLHLIDTFFIVQPGPANPDVDPIYALRESILLTSQRFIGTPYRWGGTSQRDGFDCSGLTMTVYRLNGLELPRSAYEQFRAGTPVARDVLAPGDLVFFATGRGSRISHVGIYSGHDQFIHAPGQGKTIRSASLSNSYFENRYKGARRFF